MLLVQIGVQTGPYGDAGGRNLALQNQAGSLHFQELPRGFLLADPVGATRVFEDLTPSPTHAAFLHRL